MHFGGCLNGVVLHLENQIALADACSSGRRALDHIFDQNAIQLGNCAGAVGGIDFSCQLRREVHQLHADKGMGGLTGADDLLRDPLGQVDRNRKTQAATRRSTDCSVDADHLTGGIDQGAAAVAGVHRCIGLDVGNPLAVTDRIEAADGADDAGRHGVVQAEGVADGNGPFPRLELVGVAQGRHRQVVGHYFHHRHVGEGVGAENLALETASVRKGHRHLIRTTDHMLIGEDQPAGPGDEAGALALLALAGGTPAKNPSEGVRDLLHHIDAHHSRSDTIHRLHDHVVPRLQRSTAGLIVHHRRHCHRWLGRQAQLVSHQAATGECAPGQGDGEPMLGVGHHDEMCADAFKTA